jgi:putative heme-binding domain-containing protein
MSLFKSLQDGASQRGAPLASAAREWGADLAERLLASAETKESDWRNLVLPGSDSANPWFVQTRISSDGDKSARFLCSLPPDGERLTGVLRSSPFTIPAKLSFFMAGHDGPPNKPLQKKNLIRLLDDATDEVLAESRPPRNDTAQPFSWDLTKFVGRKGVLELVDGDTGSAFAWLAAGRFDPPVAALPKLDPSQMDLRSVTGAEIAGQLGLVSLVPRLALLFDDSDAQPNSRAAAAKALSLINPKPHIPRFARVLTDSAASLKLREKVAVTLGEMNLPAAGSALLAALAITPWDLQKEIALSLASTADGAELLLQAVTDGKASPRLLQERNIKDRLTASKPANVAARLEKLTLNLPPASVERQKLIQERNAGFSASQASAAQGSQTFKQYCALCHAIDGQGPVIGPQVDGIGARGLERLVEDILDPSRNVDRAFRTTLLVMKDGDVQSGLFRREEGENLVLAQSSGKEISIPKKDVQERRESETSLMPDNFSEAIPKAEFNNLLAFLLSKRPK